MKQTLKFWKKLENKAFKKHGGHRHHSLIKSHHQQGPRSAGQLWRLVRRKYPILYKMSLRDRVPDKMLDQIKAVANDPKMRGLVRQVVYDNGTKRGYTVLMLSNDALTQAGFGRRHGNKDFGRLIKDIRNNDVYTVTMRGDALNGFIVLRPDMRTLKLLYAYEELEHSKLQWGIFPADLNPTSGEQHSIPLSDLIPLDELVNEKGTGLAQKKPAVALEVKNDEIQVVGQKPASQPSPQAQQTAEQSASSESSEDSTLSQSIPTASNTSQSTAPSSNSSAQTGDGGFAAFTAGGNDSSQAPSSSSQPSSSSSENVLAEELAKSSETSNNSNDQTPKKVVDRQAPQTPESSANEPENSENVQSDVSDFNSDMNDSASGAALESEFEDAMEDNPVGPNRQQRNHEASQIPTKQSPADFYGQMNDVDERTFNDNSLDISINYSADLSGILGNESAPLFPLRHYKKGDRLGKLLNETRADYNAALKADEQHAINSVNSDSLSRITKVILDLEHRLNINDTRNPYGQQMASAGNTYTKQLRYDDKNADDAQQDVQKSLGTMKNSYMDRAAQEAGAAFDQQYADYPKKYRQKYAAERHTQTNNTYQREKADIYNRRRHTANLLAQESWAGILKDAREDIQKLFDRISARRQTMQNQLINLHTHYNEAEYVSEQNEAAVADNHLQMKRLGQKMNRQRQHYEQQLASERAENKRQHRTEKARFNRELKKSQELTDKYRDKYTNVGQQKDQYYHKRFRSLQKELKNSRSQIRNRDADISEYLRSPKHVSEMWHNPWLWAVIAGIVAIGGFGMTAMLHKAMSNNNNQAPYLGVLEHNEDQNSSRASYASSASSVTASMSASTSSAIASVKSHSSNSSDDSDLMTTRPSNGDGYIATSETHNPTNYVKVSRNNKFSTGSTVSGKVNGKVHSLNVITKSGNEVYLKDNNNNQIYEFNL